LGALGEGTGWTYRKLRDYDDRAEPVVCNRDDRMPVIIDAAEIDTWLSPKTLMDELTKLLDSYPEQHMPKQRVSKKDQICALR
jgi:putative SOS response-associated peptidase YedK